MQKISQRVAALAPSITIGLILFTIGLTALLAYRAFDASRAQRRMTEQTLREYAGFAAFQLRSASIARMTGRYRGVFELVLRAINTRGPTPPLSAERAAELIEARGEQCRCLDGVSFYYQVTFADNAIDATDGDNATPADLQQLRDTVLAQARGLSRADQMILYLAGVRPAGVPITSQYLVTIFSSLGERPFVLTHALTVDADGTPVVAYGLAVPAELLMNRTVRSVLATQSVLPGTLTRGMSLDSVLAVTVSTASRQVIYASNAAVAPQYAAVDSLDDRLGGLRFEVAINPAAAGRLIIGGLPRSRFPEVLATALVAVSLLGLLLFQFRRQEELGRLRGEFVSGVSHELRTPLAQIRLLAELLREGKVPSEDQKDRSLRIIDKEARRLSFLVESILSFTHAERARMSPVRTDVVTEIEEIVSGFEPLAQAESVRLTTRLEAGLVAHVDRSALRQVLLNLLDNAVRYGPPGQEVTITATSGGATWTLEVADEGPGVPTDERERIFDPYYRMKRDAGGAIGGTGIGLSVVSRLVAAHHGDVYVRATNGHGAAGARFVVSLPVNATRVNEA